MTTIRTIYLRLNKDLKSNLLLSQFVSLNRRLVFFLRWKFGQRINYAYAPFEQAHTYWMKCTINESDTAVSQSVIMDFI